MLVFVRLKQPPEVRLNCLFLGPDHKPLVPASPGFVVYVGWDGPLTQLTSGVKYELKLWADLSPDQRFECVLQLVNEQQTVLLESPPISVIRDVNSYWLEIVVP